MAHSIVNTDNMAGTRQGALLRSFKLFGSAGRAETDRIDVDNGNVVELKGLLANEREVFAAEAPVAAANLEDLVLVAGVEIMYDERKRNLDEFYNDATDPAAIRGYHFIPNAVFSTTAESFANASPAVGQMVGVSAGSTLLDNAATVTGTKIGEIIDTYTTGTKTFYSVMVKVN